MLVFERPKANPRPAGEGRVRGQQLAQKSKSALGRGDDLFTVKNLSTCPPIHFKKAAFTLAEVLITLGIIGVVAAITIPGLIVERQKRATVTKLERAISIINQAYRLSYDDVGDASAETAYAMGPEEYIKTYWEPYLKFNLVCTTYSQCGYESIKPLQYSNGSACDSQIISSRSRIGVQTMDGFIYIIFTSSWDNNASNAIWLDLNGPEKPNRFGKDVFYLERKQDSGVLMYCHDRTDAAIKSECSSSGTGQCCAERIRRAGWKIEKDYPWK